MLLQKFVRGKTYIQHPILVFGLVFGGWFCSLGVWVLVFFFCRHETNPQNSGMCFTVPYSSKQDIDDKN